MSGLHGHAQRVGDSLPWHGRDADLFTTSFWVYMTTTALNGAANGKRVRSKDVGGKALIPLLLDLLTSGR